MPIYEYECSACKAVFEQLVYSKNDEKAVVCPKCGAKRIVRRPSVFAAHDAPARPGLQGGACPRCGDPNGSCGLG